MTDFEKRLQAYKELALQGLPVVVEPLDLVYFVNDYEKVLAALRDAKAKKTDSREKTDSGC